jgi:hypothetical protein
MTSLLNKAKQKILSSSNSKMAKAPEKFEGFMIKSTDKWSDFSKEKVYSRLEIMGQTKLIIL